MKKLMMLAAAIALAVVGQAASVTWGIANNSITMDGGGYPAKGSTVSLIMASDYSAVADALSKGTSISSYVLESKTTTNTKGYVANHEFTSDKLVKGTDAALAILVQDGDKFVVSQAVTFSPYVSGVDEAAAKAFGATNFSAANTLSGGWASTSGGGDTPEPTSGLLLLVGAGMLALRRKQK